MQETMNAQMQDALSPPQVKATFRLGSESYSVEACKGIISEQLISMKEQSMTILKDYITKHNVPNEVPDEPEEFSSEDDGEIPEQPPVKSKKRK
uniref:Putative ovule protein n=1 Tax=Solanum chacoense TaxID=4108 RepID=A0A0V0HAE6_SOLCH